MMHKREMAMNSSASLGSLQGCKDIGYQFQDIPWYEY